MLVRVGMWLPDEEESVWGDLLYDLAFMIGMSIDSDSAEILRDEIAQKLISHIEKPTTEYSGRYYSSEQDGAEQPATAPKSKLEGNSKPQPESEGRSQ